MMFIKRTPRDDLESQLPDASVSRKATTEPSPRPGKLKPEECDEPAKDNAWGLPYHRNWVILQFEYMSEEHMRALTVVLSVVIAASLLAYIVVIALSKDWIKSTRRDAFKVHVGIGCVTVPFLLVLLGVFTTRLLGIRLRKMCWALPRWKAACSALAKMLATLGMLGMYIGVNSYGLANQCLVFDHKMAWIAYVRLTFMGVINLMYVIDTHQLILVPGRGRDPDRFAGEKSVLELWPELALMLFNQLVLTGSLVKLLRQDQADYAVLDNGSCDQPETSDTCQLGEQLRLSEISMLAVLALTMGLLLFYSALAWRRLHTRRYQDYKLANIKLRVQLRFHLTSLTVYLLASASSWLLNNTGCKMRVLLLFGIPPAIVTIAVMTMLDGILYLPIRPGFWPERVVADLQQVAWTVEEQQKVRQQRLKHLSSGGAADPLFCMETAVKMFWWSVLVYDYTDSGSGQVLTGELEFMADISRPMAWDRLESVKLFWDAESEAKALVLWNATTIIVTFRGSAATANFIADATLVQTAYPPDQEPPSCCRKQSMVHLGFLQTWQSLNVGSRKIRLRKSAGASSGGEEESRQPSCSGMRWWSCSTPDTAPDTEPPGEGVVSGNRLVREVYSLLEAAPGGPGSVKLVFTGHSLGGALASIAALDVQRACDLQPNQVQVYTFGCPRQGNHAFAKLYDAALPHTWHVVNDCDLVCRSMKLLGAYKRAGQRSIINASGHLIVRPCYIEMVLLKPPFAGRVNDHFLLEYRKSLLKVLEAEMQAELDSQRAAELRRVRAMLLHEPEAAADDGGKACQSAESVSKGASNEEYAAAARNPGGKDEQVADQEGLAGRGEVQDHGSCAGLTSELEAQPLDAGHEEPHGVQQLDVDVEVVMEGVCTVSASET